MIGRRATVFAMVGILLLGPIASADHGGTGLRAPIDAFAAVTSVQVAWSSGAFMAGTVDPGGLLQPPTSPDPDRPVWYLWTPAGDPHQDGDADPAVCDDPAQLLESPGVEDCSTPAVAVAISQDGSRMVVVADADEGTVVLFATKNEGGLDGFKSLIPGTAVGVGMSDDGRIIAVGTDRGATNGGGIHLFEWRTSITQKWSDSLEDAVDAITLAPDGATVVAGADGTHYRYSVAGGTESRVADADFPGAVQDVQVSTSSRHLSIAGSDSGHFVLYEDGTLENRRALRARNSDDPLTAVTITRDGTRFATGNDQGMVWVYDLDPLRLTLTGRGSIDVGGAVRDLAFSADGGLLAAAAADGARLVDTTAAAPGLLWQDAVAPVGEVAMTRDGETVVAASGSHVRVYDAVHNVTATVAGQPLAVVPGAALDVTVRMENHGNRIVKAPLAVDLPDNWTALATPVLLRLAPGGAQDVAVALTVPPQQAPGNVTIRLLLGGHAPVTFDLAVPEHPLWRLEAVDAVQSRGTASDGTAHFELRVKNVGNVEAVPPLEATMDAPGWRVSLESPQAAVPPGGSANATLVLQAPAQAAELERATATVTVGGTTPDSLAFTATVGARFEMVLESPGGVTVQAGNDTTIALKVRNKGNTVDGARVTLSGVPSVWQAGFGTSGMQHVIPLLAVGEAATVQLGVAVPVDVMPGPPFQLVLQLHSLGDPSQTATRTLLVTVTEAAPPEQEGGRKIPALAPGLALLVLFLLCRHRNKPKTI